MEPTITRLIFIVILIFILRYIILEYTPDIIINGYISIFMSFFIFTFLFTKNILFSVLIGLFTIHTRILYRSIKDKSILNDYNSFSNCFIFLFGLLLLSVILFNYSKFNKHVEKYYSHVLFILISSNLYFLRSTPNDNNLMCYP
jgi:hypothetical protein